jgi:hypothetical protein
VSATHIEYVHASAFGNGARVAQEFASRMEARGATVSVHHVGEIDARRLPAADCYVFSSPGRFSRPIKGMRRFLKKLNLPAGTGYAILATGLQPQPDPKTGQMPSQEELGKCERVVPLMREALDAKGLVELAEDKVLVTSLKGPLEGGWQGRVEAFAARLAKEAA